MGTKEQERQAVPQARFICQGGYWTLAFEARVIRLRDSKGLQNLALLLREPGREFHVLDLGARIDPGEIDSSASRNDPEQLAQLTVHSTLNGDNGEFLDAQGRAAYKQHLVELKEELEEARRFQDQGRIARIEGEKHLVMGELKAAFGLSGRSRIGSSAAEKARVNVTKNIGRALEQIEAKHESLGRFLKSTIKTGIFCSYQSDPRFPVAWKFEAEQFTQTISSTELAQRIAGNGLHMLVHGGPHPDGCNSIQSCIELHSALKCADVKSKNQTDKGRDLRQTVRGGGARVRGTGHRRRQHRGDRGRGRFHTWRVLFQLQEQGRVDHRHARGPC